MRCPNCSVKNCPEEDYPPRPLPIRPDYIENLQRRLGKAMKGILPPTLKMILKMYYPRLARQAPVHPQQQKKLSCSPPPTPYTKPKSLRDDQIKSSSFGAQADGRKYEQLEISLEVQPDDMTGRHRDGEHDPLERAQASENEGKVGPKRECLALQSPSACEGMEGPGEPHPVTRQTAANGISHEDQGTIFGLQTEFGIDLKKQHKSPFAFS